MVKQTKWVTSDDLLAQDLQDPEFREEWERTALARAISIAVLRHRADNKLSQTALANQLGMRQPHIARLESGEHHPSIAMLRRLSKGLGLRFILEVAPCDTPRNHAERESSEGSEVLAADGVRIAVCAKGRSGRLGSSLPGWERARERVETRNTTSHAGAIILSTVTFGGRHPCIQKSRLSSIS